MGLYKLAQPLLIPFNLRTDAIYMSREYYSFLIFPCLTASLEAIGALSSF